MTLHDLASLIEEECRQAKEQGLFGTREFHVEKLERLPDKNGTLLFRVTTWNDESEHPRKHREMGLIDLLNLLGRVIGHRALHPALDLISPKGPPATP